MASTDWADFKLRELRLDEQNFRTGPVQGQRGAILAIVEEQKRKLVNLGRDILEMAAVSPGEPIWVTRDLENAGKYIVLEGNRRVCALMLMDNPTLADGTIVERAFKELSRQFTENPIRELEARIFASREAALPWQLRRHLRPGSGVGLERWARLAQARANRTLNREAEPFYAVFTLLEDDSEEWAEIVDPLMSRWSTVDRVLNAGDFESILGVQIDTTKNSVKFGNDDIEAGKNLLRQILRAIGADDFSFASVERDTDRTAFINRFANLSVKAPAPPPSGTGGSGLRGVAAATGGTPAAVSPPTTATPARQSRITSDVRSTLAPRTGPRTFQVNGVRLNPLYKECREIKVRGNENAAAFLLRVFIELSSEALLVEKNIPLPTSATRGGRITSWADFGISLSTKVEQVIQYLDPTGRNRIYQQIRAARDATSSSTFSINILHSYFHNLNMQPVGSALQEAWNAWEPYLKALHAAR